MSNIENDKIKELENKTIDEMLQDSEDTLIENDNKDIDTPIKLWHEWHIKIYTVKQLLKMKKDKSLIIPTIQRGYVWNKKLRDGLLDSIEVNIPCSTITLCVLDEVTYLIDGLQRIVSNLILVGEYAEDNELLKVINSYKIACTIIEVDTMLQMKDLFIIYNSTSVKVSVIERKLAVIEDSTREVLDTIANTWKDVDMNNIKASYFKSGHPLHISANILAYELTKNEIGLKGQDTFTSLNTLSNLIENADIEPIISKSKRVLEVLSKCRLQVSKYLLAQTNIVSIYKVIDKVNDDNIDNFVKVLDFKFNKLGKSKRCIAPADYSSSYGSNTIEACKKRTHALEVYISHIDTIVSEYITAIATSENDTKDEKENRKTNDLKGFDKSEKAKIKTFEASWKRQEFINIFGLKVAYKAFDNDLKITYENLKHGTRVNVIEFLKDILQGDTYSDEDIACYDIAIEKAIEYDTKKVESVKVKTA